MNIVFRSYQADGIRDILTAWQSGAARVLYCLPTGGGKTVVIYGVISRLPPGTKVLCIAHRKELVSQISLTLARQGVRHDLVVPMSTYRDICRIHYRYNEGVCTAAEGAPVAVASVDTVRSRKIDVSDYQYIVIDEGHHVTEGNKWGDIVESHTGKVLMVTATPERTDCRAIIHDRFIVGPSRQELTDAGHLVDLQFYCPETYIDLTGVNTGKSGDYVLKKLAECTKASPIVGDMVSNYLRIAPGKRGISFLPSVELAEMTAERFNAAGVPAMFLSGISKDSERFDAVEKLRTGELLQLTNVDLFSEGFDLPAVEVVSMGRKTESFSWFSQACGRAARTAPGKTCGTVIDHVGNTIRHGRYFASDISWRPGGSRKKAAADPDTIPLSVCPSCTRPYRRFLSQCPYCGYKPVPTKRTDPVETEGDLTVLDPETLAALALRCEMPDPDKAAASALAAGADQFRVNCIRKSVRGRADAQQLLRRLIYRWGDIHRAAGYDDASSQRKFFFDFRVDIMSAQQYKTKDAEKLIEKLQKVLANAAV